MYTLTSVLLSLSLSLFLLLSLHQKIMNRTGDIICHTLRKDMSWRMCEMGRMDPLSLGWSLFAHVTMLFLLYWVQFQC
jgi:hypothetical protein